MTYLEGDTSFKNCLGAERVPIKEWGNIDHKVVLNFLTKLE